MVLQPSRMAKVLGDRYIYIDLNIIQSIMLQNDTQ